MPIQYGSVTISAWQDETTIVDKATFLQRIRGSGSGISGLSQTDLNLLGRDRHPIYPAAYTQPKFKHIIAQRRRGCEGTGTGRTETHLHWLTSVPAIPPPGGKLTINDEDLANKRLPKSRSHTLSFIITGKRLLNLRVRFLLRDLRGKEILAKQVLLKPGGIAINEIIDNLDGTQTITGWIILLPRDTVLAGTPDEAELNYVFDIGNKTSREHLLESNYLYFYKV